GCFGSYQEALVPEPEPQRASARWNPERWAAAKKVLEGALELPESQRKSYVAEACGEDLELREEVESVLAFHDPETSFMEYPPINEIFPQSDMVGQRLGIYQIV